MREVAIVQAVVWSYEYVLGHDYYQGKIYKKQKNAEQMTYLFQR